MTILRRLSRRLRSLFFRRQTEAEMAEEMRFHLEQRMADKLDDGLSPEEATFAAQRKFGNLASIQEQARAGRGWTWLDNLAKDLTLGVRNLARSPGFALLAIITLGLGIGANTAMFSAMNSIMLRPLPYPEHLQLDRVFRATAQTPYGAFSPADFRDLQQNIGAYGEISAYAPGVASLAEPGQPPEMASAFRVTTNLFGLLRTNLQFGRDFRANEETPGNDRVVILSQRVWQNRFGGRADIVGRTIRLDGEPHEVIGVLPASFNDWRHLGNIDLFRPLALTKQQAADRRTTWLSLLGRRRSDVTIADAEAFFAGMGARLTKDYPAENTGATWRVQQLQKRVAGTNGEIMFVLLVGLSGFVALIACSNLANLLLARTMTRAREFAVRAALGASRLQLLRPLITEALLLALAGGVCAIIVALWAGDWLSVRSTGDNGERVHIFLDWHVFVWALGASLVTAVAFGLAPALFALRLDLNGTLKSGARGSTGGRGQQRFRQFLIVGQFALAMILLTGAALFIRGLDELNHRRSGWESERLVSGSLLLPAGGYSSAEKITAFYRLAQQRLEALPGVTSATVAAFTPYFSWADSRKFAIAGHVAPPTGQEPAASINGVAPRYFETVGTHLLAGRTFTERDNADSTRVFVINQTLAKNLFGSASPLGQRITFLGGATPLWGEIIGVVNDVVSVVPDQSQIGNQIYQPIAQAPRLRCEILVHTDGAVPSTLAERIRTTMAELDPDLPIRDLKTADAAIERANYQQAVLRDMLTGFGVLGLALASLGIYGVIARTMAQRTSEFAIRLALGASVRDITRLVLGTGVRQALVGAALGLAGAVMVARFLASTFPGMRMNSLPVLFGTTLLLVAVALLACWLPARRAGKVDAMGALRAE